MMKLYSKKPMRMWIDGTCFNITKLEKMKSNSVTTLSEIPTDHNFVLSKSDSCFTTTFQLPSDYYTQLNDFKEPSMQNLQTITNTIITVPENDGNITISGDNESNVVNARHWMHSIIAEIHSNQRAVQFISIPVNSEEVQRNFQQFKDEILNDHIEGVDETIFIPPIKLHLTIGVFALMSSSEKDEAISALNACKTEVIAKFFSDGNQLKIQVSGIDCMQGNHLKAKVLYANAKIKQEDDEAVLQKLANAISDYFYNRGLIIQYTDNVKLHVTLMNIKYRSVPHTKKRSRWPWWKQHFNATSILEKYKNFYFGEKILDSVHISYMTTIGEDGFYKPLSIITF